MPGIDDLAIHTGQLIITGSHQDQSRSEDGGIREGENGREGRGGVWYMEGLCILDRVYVYCIYTDERAHVAHIWWTGLSQSTSCKGR